MYYKQPYGDPTVSAEVDRALGVSYTVVKEVYNQLDLLKSYKESWTALADYDKSLKTLNTTLNTISNANKLGTFIGHDMGRVGVEPTKETFTGENFASALTRNWDNINIVANNIADVQRLAIYLNQVKALAYITDEINLAAANIEAVKELNTNYDVYNRLYLNIKEVLNLEGNLDLVRSVNTAVNTFSDIQANLEVLQHVHEYLHIINSLNSNISIYEKADLNLKTYLEILEFRYEITNLSNNIINIKTAADIVDKQVDLVQKFTELVTIKDDISALAQNTESIKNVANSLVTLDNVYDNLSTYTVALTYLDDIKEVNKNTPELKTLMSTTNTNISKAEKDITAMYQRIDQTTKFIDNFNSNLPSNALLTNQNNRVNVLLGSIKKTDIDTYTDTWEAPSNGWFVNYYYGESQEDTDSEIKENLTCNDVTITLKIKKPNGHFDDCMQLYVVKGSTLTITATNLKTLTGKIQFIKQLEGDE